MLSTFSVPRALTFRKKPYFNPARILIRDTIRVNLRSHEHLLDLILVFVPLPGFKCDSLNQKSKDEALD